MRYLRILTADSVESINLKGRNDMKRIVALLLAVVCALTVVGCGKKKREIIKLTLSTEDSEAILAAAGIMLPPVEDVSDVNTKIKWFSWYDSFHNYSEDEIINTGFWTFEQKYNGEIEWVECEWGARFDDLANLILSNESPDFLPLLLNAFPTRAIKGLFRTVDEYIDYDDPLWVGTKPFAYDYYSLAGKTYAICTDYGSGNVAVYNRRVMEEWGFDDPATLFANDEWTWDVFYDMCANFSDPDEDRYALDGWWFAYSLMRSCGQTIVEYNTETRLYESNLDSPSIEKAANLLYDLSKNECVYPWWANGWSIRNATNGSGLKDGKLLFYFCTIDTFTGPVEEISNVWGDVTANEVMFCPAPRDPNGDGGYYTECYPSGYCIAGGANNPEGVVLFASCERFKILDPTVISIDLKQKKEIYLWTEEMLDMDKTCYELACAGNYIVPYDSGLGDKLASVVDAFENNAHSQDAKTWAQLKEANYEKLEFYLSELNDNLKEIDK